MTSGRSATDMVADYLRQAGIGGSVKSFSLVRVVGVIALSSVANDVQAQTALQPGLWEVTDKTTIAGAEKPAASQRVCLKAGDATLERLLIPSPEEFAKRGCTLQPAPKQPGLFKAILSCPATDQRRGVTANAEITYKADSYEGVGQLLLKDKAGTTVQGSSKLSGKRVGDC
jgi:hypothetical protein